jgi:D-proline reductase (dithiol) PrdB
VDLEQLDTAGLAEKYDEWIAFIDKTHHASNPRRNDPVPFAPLVKPLSECRVALLTTAGAHLDDQPPFHIETVAGDPSYRIIPDDADLSRVRFTHTHYDTSSAEQDTNVVLPIDRLHELVDRGRVGSASPIHIGMMGFNPDPNPVADELGPAVAGLLSDAEVDVALLMPG